MPTETDTGGVTYLEAIRQGLTEEMERDPSVFCLGEDIGKYGGAFKVTEGLLDRFGADRVIDTPISETGFVGAAAGAASAGRAAEAVAAGVATAASSARDAHACNVNGSAATSTRPATLERAISCIDFISS